MPDRLPMGADGDHLGWCHRCRFQQIRHGRGVNSRYGIACQGGAMQFIATGRVQGKQLTRELSRELAVDVSPHRRRILTAQADKHAIDAIERSAGHQSDEQTGHDRAGYSWKSPRLRALDVLL